MARKSFVVMVAGTMIFFLCSVSSAVVPDKINYQGKLTTAQGGCLNDTVSKGRDFVSEINCFISRRAFLRGQSLSMFGQKPPVVYPPESLHFPLRMFHPLFVHLPLLP